MVLNNKPLFNSCLIKRNNNISKSVNNNDLEEESSHLEEESSHLESTTKIESEINEDK